MTRVETVESRPRPRGLPGNARRRLRLPLLLLGAMVLNALAISSLTLYALRGERAALEASRNEAAERALALLGSQVEQAVMSSVQPPFLLLKNLSKEDLLPARSRSLRQNFPAVEQVLILDRNLQLRQSSPAIHGKHLSVTTEWLVQRVQEELRNVEHAAFDLHTFIDKLDGRNWLFAFQALSEAPDANPNNKPEAWVVLRLRLDDVVENAVKPVLQQFEDDGNGTAVLLPPDAPANKHVRVLDLNDPLPGWRVGLVKARHETEASRDIAIVVVAGSAVLAILLAGVAGWWEMRREYALLDLRNRFVASVSHELKTPLALIRMYAETLFLARQPDPARQHQYLGIMLRESERLSLMINDVLGFALAREGRDVPSLSAKDLAGTVVEVVTQYEQHFAARGLPLHLSIAPTLPAVAHDPSGITRILLNLLDNAAKYAASDAGADIDLAADGQQVTLRIADHGPGLAPAEVARLEKGYRQGEMAEGAQGSGLGLALVAHLAKGHGARFSLAAADAGGLVACVSFPVLKEAR